MGWIRNAQSAGRRRIPLESWPATLDTNSKRHSSNSMSTHFSPCLQSTSTSDRTTRTISAVVSKSWPPLGKPSHVQRCCVSGEVLSNTASRIRRERPSLTRVRDAVTPAMRRRLVELGRLNNNSSHSTLWFLTVPSVMMHNRSHHVAFLSTAPSYAMTIRTDIVIRRIRHRIVGCLYCSNQGQYQIEAESPSHSPKSAIWQHQKG
jgi:hypothetical protein